ncbi:MAG: hypothetical protein M1355_01200 [Patescibacteria group bacterium]|nr:hypothetical protein [Patescibacteria group bacterium]
MKEEKKKKESQEVNEEEDLKICDKCGSKLVEEEGEWFCPNCDATIDFFGDSDEEEL